MRRHRTYLEDLSVRSPTLRVSYQFLVVCSSTNLCCICHRTASPPPSQAKTNKCLFIIQDWHRHFNNDNWLYLRNTRQEVEHCRVKGRAPVESPARVIGERSNPDRKSVLGQVALSKFRSTRFEMNMRVGRDDERASEWRQTFRLLMLWKINKQRIEAAQIELKLNSILRRFSLHL